MKSINNKMMKTNKICLVAFLFIFLFPLINANFICGEVEDSQDNLSAQWLNTKLYYPENPSNFANCEISPAGNKYCCDAADIPGKSWKIGYQVSSEITDFEQGYAAGPVSLITTGEGYDIFPKMKLDKVIKISLSLKKLVISNNTSFLLNSSFKSPYNHVELEKEGNKDLLCNNCTNISSFINGNFGTNYLKLFASSQSSTFSESFLITFLEYFSFDREVDCENCQGGRAKHNQVVNFSLDLNLSHSVSGLELKEYVPVDWEIIDSKGGIVSEYSQTHKIISWNVSGKDITKEYVTKSPSIRFFPKKYLFLTELEDEKLNEDKITVTRFFPFFSFIQDMELKNVKKKRYSRVRPDRPIVIKPKNTEIDRIAVFPKISKKRVSFGLKKATSKELELDETINSYFFETNLDQRDIEKVFIDFKIRKDFMQEKKYTNISLFIFDEYWEEIKLNNYTQDNYYFYYQEYVKPIKGFSIVGIKESWVSIINPFD